MRDRKGSGVAIVVIQIDDVCIEDLTQEFDRIEQCLLEGCAGQSRAPEIDQRLLTPRRALDFTLRFDA